MEKNLYEHNRDVVLNYLLPFAVEIVKQMTVHAPTLFALKRNSELVTIEMAPFLDDASKMSSIEEAKKKLAGIDPVMTVFIAEAHGMPDNPTPTEEKVAVSWGTKHVERNVDVLMVIIQCIDGTLESREYPIHPDRKLDIQNPRHVIVSGEDGIEINTIFNFLG